MCIIQRKIIVSLVSLRIDRYPIYNEVKRKIYLLMSLIHLSL